MSRSVNLRNLYLEIEGKRKKTLEDPTLNLVNYKVSRRGLGREAQLTRPEDLRHIAHSARIEFPLAHIRDLPKRAQRIARKDLQRATTRLANAWTLAKIIFPDDGEFTTEYFTAIARKIEPDVVRGIRREMVLYGGQVPPEADQIESELNMFLFENKGIDLPLEKAVHVHIHLVRIHPFMDGNGRTARMVQNVLLNMSGYPPAIIEEGERHLYFDLLSTAIQAYNQRIKRSTKVTLEEDLAYEFLASKVNVAYDRLLE